MQQQSRFLQCMPSWGRSHGIMLKTMKLQMTIGLRERMKLKPTEASHLTGLVSQSNVWINKRVVPDSTVCFTFTKLRRSLWHCCFRLNKIKTTTQPSTKIGRCDSIIKPYTPCNPFINHESSTNLKIIVGYQPSSIADWPWLAKSRPLGFNTINEYVRSIDIDVNHHLLSAITCTIKYWASINLNYSHQVASTLNRSPVNHPHREPSINHRLTLINFFLVLIIIKQSTNCFSKLILIYSRVISVIKQLVDCLYLFGFLVSSISYNHGFSKLI